MVKHCTTETMDHKRATTEPDRANQLFSYDSALLTIAKDVVCQNFKQRVMSITALRSQLYKLFLRILNCCWSAR